MTCNFCGKELPEHATSCSYCGASVGNLNEGGSNEKIGKRIDLQRYPILYYLVLESILDSVVKLIFPQNFNIVFLLGLIFVIVDWVLLSEQNVRGAWKAWGIFFPPVYLFFRAKHTTKNYRLPIVCVVLFIIALFINIYFK